MGGLYVIDTVGFINYFDSFFNEGNRLSLRTRNIIEYCFDYSHPEYKLTIPGVVFIELFEKFLRGRERVLKFRYEVFSKIENNPDIEIKLIDREVLNSYRMIDDELVKLEYHDKIITASALQLQVPIITTDSKITEFIEKSNSEIQVIF